MTLCEAEVAVAALVATVMDVGQAVGRVLQCSGKGPPPAAPVAALQKSYSVSQLQRVASIPGGVDRARQQAVSSIMQVCARLALTSLLYDSCRPRG